MKDPAMLFYTSDFLTGVQLMSMKERGQYITLLCLQQQRGHMTEKDMVKAVGKMSPELRSKFVADDEGRLYNKRAEIEIQRREAHSKKQSEKVSNRWNKNTAADTQSGNTTVYTTVLPLETAIVIETEKENNYVQDRGVQGGKDPGLASVMRLYMDRVQAMPSASCVDLLKQYTAELSADVVIHAINKALDDNTPKWSYIHGILRNYARDGLNSIEKVQKEETEYQSAKAEKRQYGRGKTQSAPVENHVTRDDIEQMRRALAKMRGEES